MTPPPTPNGSQEALVMHPIREPEPVQPEFHNFLRAFYPFRPSYATSSGTVTLPLGEGDIIMVHSIHTTGWADGTLLVSGARGWLPTNYCEAYDQEPIRVLLKALLNFWDVVKGGPIPNVEAIGNPHLTTPIVAGVRCLLVGPENFLVGVTLDMRSIADFV
jgi:SH3 domain